MTWAMKQPFYLLCDILPSYIMLYRDYFINHEIRISIKQPVCNGKSSVFFTWMHQTNRGVLFELPLRKFSPWIMLIQIRSSTLCLGFEKPFFFVWVKIYLVVRMAFVDRAFFFCGWVPGTLGWRSKRGRFFISAPFSGDGFVWKENWDKGKGRIEGGGARWTQKRSYFHGVKWDEWGVMSPQWNPWKFQAIYRGYNSIYN